MVQTPRHNNVQKMPGRIPFPELPLPSKYHKIRKVVPVPTKTEAIGDVNKIKQAGPAYAKVDIPEVVIGGEPIPESPAKRDQGDHIIENLDLSDYQ